MKKALLTGVTGQDGAYLSDLLLKKGYEVHGMVRRISQPNLSNLTEVINQITLHTGDMQDANSLYRIIDKVRPDEIYNLAAQSSVSRSFHSPLETARVDAFAVCYLLEAIRLYSPKTRFFQASSSEVFGNEKCLSETSAFSPLNPYSIAKTYAHMLTVNYRKLYNLYLVCGILFNHDSELRGDDFFTKIVSRHVAYFHLGKKDPLRVGNINVRRDIGYAPEYVDAIHLCLSGTIPEDYIISTGKSEPIRNFITYCYKAISVDLEWRGNGIHEKAYIKNTNTILVEIDPEKFRPTEVDSMESDPIKIKNTFGWETVVPLSEIAQKMVIFDINKLK
jgi:GDPmannose 4,6-dehydratase